jgi:hypothetical protein
MEFFNHIQRIGGVVFRNHWQWLHEPGFQLLSVATRGLVGGEKCFFHDRVPVVAVLASMRHLL